MAEVDIPDGQANIFQMLAAGGFLLSQQWCNPMARAFHHDQSPESESNRNCNYNENVLNNLFRRKVFIALTGIKQCLH